MELTSHLQPEKISKGQKETGESSPYVLPESFSLESIWLSSAHIRKDPESEWLARDNPETNPITIKPKAESHVAEQSSWVPLPS